jgi:hypothetical protein
LLAGILPAWLQDEDDLCDLPLCRVRDKSIGLAFHQHFNIASACFEVKTTMVFRVYAGVTLGVD